METLRGLRSTSPPPPKCLGTTTREFSRARRDVIKSMRGNRIDWVEGDRGLPSSRSQAAHHPRRPALPSGPWGPPLTPASAASDQLWLLLRISSTDQGRSHTGSDTGGRSWSGVVPFICSGKDEKRG